jgi:hypothetical protein
MYNIFLILIGVLKMNMRTVLIAIIMLGIFSACSVPQSTYYTKSGGSDEQLLKDSNYCKTKVLSDGSTSSDRNITIQKTAENGYDVFSDADMKKFLKCLKGEKGYKEFHTLDTALKNRNAI